jgi:FkbM family methyltransferase
MERSTPKLLKSLANKPLDLLGLELRRKPNTPLVPKAALMPRDMQRLAHAKGLGFSPSVVFDGGAFNGKWSRDVGRLFPDARFVLFEPNTAQHSAIAERTRAMVQRTILESCALGAAPGTATFNLWREAEKEAGASLLTHVRGKSTTELTVQVDTLDRVAERLGLWPELLKLDLQGAELLALQGGTKCLAHVQMLIAEFGCLDAYVGRTTPRQLISMADDHGLVLYDIVDLHYRPYDGALTGGDMFFVRREGPLKAYKGWE